MQAIKKLITDTPDIDMSYTEIAILLFAALFAGGMTGTFCYAILDALEAENPPAFAMIVGFLTVVFVILTGVYFRLVITRAKAE